MAKERTPEQVAADHARMAKVREARKNRAASKQVNERAVATVAGIADAIEENIATAKTEQQCPYCSLYFLNLIEHQQLVHKGEMPTVEPELPLNVREKVPAGSTVRTSGIPTKVGWSKAMLEQGWECDDPGCREEGKPGWRYIPEEGTVDPRCMRCHGPMHKLSKIDWFMVPDNAPPVVVWQGLQYWLARGERNKLPDIIFGIMEQAMEGTRSAYNAIPPFRSVGEHEAGRLMATGFLEPIEDEAPATA